MSSLTQVAGAETLAEDDNLRKKLSDEIGHNILGPIVHRWLLGLHQYITYYDDGDTGFLFCARAGVRIHKLYQEFLNGFKAASRPDADIFWVSRISACKGTFNSAGARASQIISQEYRHEPIRNLITGIFRYQPEILAKLYLDGEEYTAHGEAFASWVQGTTPAAEVMRTYLQDCGAAFNTYVNSVLRGRTRAVIIDSGWQGTMQSLLLDGFPHVTWKGLYFGRILSPGHDSRIGNDAIGVLFEENKYNPSKPETAFIRHRHIIETLLEPNAPSIEEIPAGKFNASAQALINQNKNEFPNCEKDALYHGVVRYLQGAGRGVSITDIFSRHQIAMREMERIIITPTRNEALAVICKDRSADFGKNLEVPVLLSRDDGSDAEDRVRRSLWQEGQIALEYEGGFARDLQLRAAGRSDTASYFDHSSVHAEVNEQKKPSVAIITRTKNRPLLLARAAESVAKQTYTDYVWVIVNDGGDENAVRQVIENCWVDRRKILLVSNQHSLGMEAASNTGIRNSQSDLIVIHDDDDSWERAFLERTVEFLISKQGARYGGVVTGTTYISEEIRGETVKEHHRQPYMDWVRNVQLTEMAAGNLFAPIAFMYRRRLWDEIGGYNESLPVLGDWYFNLEFLLRTDIGVLTLPLANYHHRDRGESTAYANSVIGGISKHEEFAAVARNEFIRKNAASFPGAVAAVLGYFAHDIRNAGAAPSSGRHAATAINGDGSLADKYWAVLHINMIIRRRLLPIRRHAQLDPALDWLELEEFLRTKGAAIPVPPDFSDRDYLEQNPDVAVAVKSGQFPSGYQHYLMHGRREGRSRPHKSVKSN